ncbi:MAG: hypothetical protein ACYS0K_18960 [Planctomycetota bacterium]|jgi:hypothetical protein
MSSIRRFDDPAEGVAALMAMLSSTNEDPQEREKAQDSIARGEPVRAKVGKRAVNLKEVDRTVARFRKTRVALARRQERRGRTARPRVPRLRGATVHIERPAGLPIEAEACAGLDPPTPPLHIGVIQPGVLAEIERRLRQRRAS